MYELPITSWALSGQAMRSCMQGAVVMWQCLNIQSGHCKCAIRLSFLCMPAGRIGEGGKWVCGMRALEEMHHCLVYSLGSRGDASFEEEVSERTHCEVLRPQSLLIPKRAQGDSWVLEQQLSLQG